MTMQKYCSFCNMLFFGCMLSMSTASANFFIEVDQEDQPAIATSNDLIFVYSDVVYTPDGLFVIAAAGDALVTFSRDPETGALEPVFALDEPSLGLEFSARVLEYDAEGGFLYVRGQFGFTAVDDPSLGLDHLIKLQFDSSNGMLSFVEALNDPDGLIDNILSDFDLTDDGQFLVVGSPSNITIDSKLHLIDASSMNIVDSIENSEEQTLLPNFIQAPLTLSADNRFIYMVGVQDNSQDDFTDAVGIAVVALDTENQSMEVIQTIPIELFEGDPDTVDLTNIPALIEARDVIATADGRFVYTDGATDRVDSNTSGDDFEAVGLWRVESDGSLTFQRSYDRAALLSGFPDVNRVLRTGERLVLSPGDQEFLYVADRVGVAPVSYTHLTLPTICSV